MLIVLAVLMFVVAVVFSMLGQGGGVLYTPIQVWAGIEFHVAATTSLFLIMVISLSASIVFRKANKIDWPLALVLETSTTLGGFSGGLWSGRFSGSVLSVLFAAVIVVAAFFMIRSFETKHDCGQQRSGILLWRRSFGQQSYCVNLAVAVFFGGQIGSRISVGLDKKKLKKGFGWFLLVMAVAMFVRAAITPS